MTADMITFEELLRIAAREPALAEVLSFVQVEYGLDELKAHWQGFLDSAEASGSFWADTSYCINDFALNLMVVTDYGESVFV